MINSIVFSFNLLFFHQQAEWVKKAKVEIFPRFLGYFETLLARNGNNGYLVGNKVNMLVCLSVGIY